MKTIIAAITLLHVMTSIITAQNFEQLEAKDTSEYYDFWVGNWKVSWDEAGGMQGSGHNQITKILDGRGIQEDFQITEGQSKGFKGTSISILTNQNIWKQTWMDNGGGYFDFTGGLENGNPVFKTADAELNGQISSQKMTFNHIEKNRFVWDWEGTRDGGKTWNLLWQIQYERME